MADYNLDLEKALDIVYSSDVFQKLSDPATALYKEGPTYIYSFLEAEITSLRQQLARAHSDNEWLKGLIDNAGLKKPEVDSEG